MAERPKAAVLKTDWTASPRGPLDPFGWPPTSAVRSPKSVLPRGLPRDGSRHTSSRSPSRSASRCSQIGGTGCKPIVDQLDSGGKAPPVWGSVARTPLDQQTDRTGLSYQGAFLGQLREGVRGARSARPQVRLRRSEGRPRWDGARTGPCLPSPLRSATQSSEVVDGGNAAARRASTSKIRTILMEAV
jgi:hypothetical protein